MRTYFNYILFLLSFSAFAQVEGTYKNYTWDKNSIENFDITKHQNEEIVAVKEKELHDFVVINKTSFIEYKLIHNIYWLNSNDKIEEYNKVYLPIFSNSQLVTSRARVITSSRKIIELDASKILEAKDEESQVTYKYFALEGVEKGAFIEYFYITKNQAKYSGNQVTLQSDYKKYNVDFELIAPKNLEFKFKSYNGLIEIKKDTSITDKNYWKLHLDQTKALLPEEKAPYPTLLKHLVYKLDRNVDNPSIVFFDYEKFSQNSYRSIYKPIDKVSNKAIKAFIKTLDFTNVKSPIEKLQIIESEIKTSFYISPQNASDTENIASILKTKISSEYGIIKLYAALLKHLEIENQLVFTSNRATQKFDPKFEAYHFISDYLFYLVKDNSYLAPLDVSSRLGFPNGYLTDTYGVFVTPIKLGDFTSGKANIKYIEAIDYKKSTDSMFVDIRLDKNDLSITKIDFNQRYTGYKAIYLQPFIHLTPEDSKKELLENFLNQYYPNVTVHSASFENDGKNDFGKLPFVLNADMETSNYINRAGKKYLFKIGELIGPQVEMYQEKKRLLPAEDRNTKLYFRKLTFEIPEGYTVKNLTSLILDESYKNKKGEIEFLFKSNYTIEGNILTVLIDEYYNQNIIPASIYENYRKVINSAADFNKATLIIEK